MINRASEIADYTGRTLEGAAYRYDRPSRVTDDSWESSYYEEILRGADSKTLTEQGSFPLLRAHESVQLGDVSFSHSDDESALMFTAQLHRNAEADAVLEDIESWSDVSIGFAAIRNGERYSDHHGKIVQRAEIRLHELSLAPTGTGLTKGAEVLAIRSATTPRLDRLRQKRIILL
jgi:HK97 family phage prohead protease